MKEQSYSMMNDDWVVNADGSFTSPLMEGHPAQMILFGDRMRNGSISSDITIFETENRRRERVPALEATLIVRYTGQEGYYYAGTGAFNTKFFIGKMLPGPLWQLRAYVGLYDNIHKNKTYRLRLEFNGSQLTLYENDVQQLILLDEDYQAGQCGFGTWQTKAKFENIQIVRAKPRAFLIMPFTSELNFVHRIISQTIEAYGIDCVRADEIAISRPVMDDVKNQIATADLVIVDFTGRNPNVYYEAGLADAWKKDWIILAQASQDMTFDVRHIRSIRYTNTMGADMVLKEDLARSLEALGYRPVTSNPSKDSRVRTDTSCKNEQLNTNNQASGRHRNPRKREVRGSSGRGPVVA